MRESTQIEKKKKTYNYGRLVQKKRSKLSVAVAQGMGFKKLALFRCQLYKATHKGHLYNVKVKKDIGDKMS